MLTVLFEMQKTVAFDQKNPPKQNEDEDWKPMICCMCLCFNPCVFVAVIGGTIPGDRVGSWSTQIG